MSRIGQHAHDHPLNQPVQNGAGDEAGEESEGHIAARIFRLARRNQRSLETSICKDEKHHRLCPAVGAARHARFWNNVASRDQVKRSGCNNQAQRAEFRRVKALLT